MRTRTGREADAGCERAVGLLAGVLLACPRFRPPGADGQTVADVVAAGYPAAAAAGWVPGPAALAAAHPELAEDLASYFGGANVPTGIAS